MASSPDTALIFFSLSFLFLFSETRTCRFPTPQRPGRMPGPPLPLMNQQRLRNSLSRAVKLSEQSGGFFWRLGNEKRKKGRRPSRQSAFFFCPSLRTGACFNLRTETHSDEVSIWSRISNKQRETLEATLLVWVGNARETDVCRAVDFRLFFSLSTSLSLLSEPLSLALALARPRPLPPKTENSSSTTSCPSASSPPSSSRSPGPSRGSRSCASPSSTAPSSSSRSSR